MNTPFIEPFTHSGTKKCSHTNISPVCSHDLISYSYCYNCGILILDRAKQNKMTKPKNMEKSTDIDPLIILREMNKKFCKVLYPKKVNESYFSKRNHILSYLQDIGLDLDYSDAIFYLALLYVDQIYKLPKYLSLIEEDNFSKKENDLIITACLLLAAKFAENDILEPDLGNFESSNKKYILNQNDLLKMEIQILKDLNYNLNYYTAYDYLMVLMNNGFIFENEIRSDANIHDIYAYSKKVLAMITPTKILLIYSPFQIALSIIETTRDHFNFQKNYDLLHKIYNVSFEQYEKCYADVSDVMNETNRRVINRIKSFKDISKMDIECDKQKKLKPIYNKWCTPDNGNKVSCIPFKFLRKSKDKTSKTVKLENKMNINKISQGQKNGYLSKPYVSILKKKGSEDPNMNTNTIKQTVKGAFICCGAKHNQTLKIRHSVDKETKCGFGFLGKIFSLGKTKKTNEVSLPVISQKGSFNNSKITNNTDSVNNKEKVLYLRTNKM